MCVGLHLKYLLFLSDFTGTLIFSKDFPTNNQVANFIKILPLGTELHAGGQRDGRTGRQDEATVGFGNKFVDGGNDRNVNGDINLLSMNVCAILCLP
jgi:hypothetical protein